ncbi:MAG: prolyl oligopeptidase family serine peptidase [Verrucomicrobia bacterium]|nr:prolyl oligopeptidase family serine peptidase [Verrucomicrobiota bacterium]
MRFSCLALIFCCGAAAALAQSWVVHLPPPDRELPLYAGVAPGSEKWDWEERTVTRPDGHVATQNVVRPVLQYFAPNPAKANGTAVIIAPGGGHTNLVIVHDGRRLAEQLQAKGIAAFILKYRTIHVGVVADSSMYYPEKRENGVITTGAQQGQKYADFESDDGRQAVRVLRAHAAEFKVDPKRIGFLGSSAGGIPVMAAVFAPAEVRPDFAALISGPYGIDQPVPADAPPLFLAAAASDDDWGANDSLKLFNAWRAAKRPTEIHIFQVGGHGFLKPGAGDHVIDRLCDWMADNGWMAKPAAPAAK